MASHPQPHLDDYYALLGVHAGADAAELRRAWRRLAVQYHPDRAGHGATAAFQRLSAAYEVLSDPLARRAYDRRRGRSAHAGATGAAPSRSAAPTRATAAAAAARPAAPGVMLGRVCGALASLIACGVARQDDDDPALITLVLRQDEAAQGGMVTISMPIDVRCPRCAADPRARHAGCPRCGGTGAVEELFSAWLAVPPGVHTGEVLAPSAQLPDTVQPVRFRVWLAETSSRASSTPS